MSGCQNYDEKKDFLNEKCGVVGVYGDNDAVYLAKAGLFSLQHRGQESCGFIFFRDEQLIDVKGLGLVNDVFTEDKLRLSSSHAVIAHTRYSTSGDKIKNIQPILSTDKKSAFAHNGNIPNHRDVKSNYKYEYTTDSDTEVINAGFSNSKSDSIQIKLKDALMPLKGSYSIVGLVGDSLVAARDPKGYRPLSIGEKTNNFGQKSYMIASESCALEFTNFKYVRDVLPGEIIVIDKFGFHSYKNMLSSKKLNHCIFELIYFARPDSFIFGISVYDFRKHLGRTLAKNHPVSADIVIGVPDSSLIHALGFSEESKIPFELGILRSHYMGRSFIQPDKLSRNSLSKIKYNPIRSAIKGKKVVIVDDSIVRGVTQDNLIPLIRKCEPKEIHLRIASPAIIAPCYTGIDMSKYDELIFNTEGKNISKLAKRFNVDSVEYLTIPELKSCVEDFFKRDMNDFCNSCFTDTYFE